MKPYKKIIGVSLLWVIILMTTAFNLQSITAFAQSRADISIRFADAKSFDSVQVTLLFNRSVLIGSSPGVTQSAINDIGRPTRLTFNLSGNQGIFLIKTFKGTEEDYLPFLPIAKGDNIQIQLRSNQCSFSGKGSEKVRLTFDLDNMHKKFRTEYYEAPSSKKGVPNTKDNWERMTTFFFELPLDSLLEVKIAYLNKFQNHLSKNDYLWLKANTIVQDYNFRFRKFARWKQYGLLVDSTQVPFYSKIYLKYLKKLKPYVQDNEIIKCPGSGHFYLSKWIEGRKLDPDFPSQDKDVFVYANVLPQHVRNVFMTSYLLEKEVNTMQDSLVSKAMKLISSPEYLQYFSTLRKNVKIGDAAYNFQLENTEGKKVRLSDFKGKVVFMDFWFTGCKWCKVYYEDKLKDVEEHFKGSKDIVFLSICIDNKKETWLKSNEEGSYNGPESINLYTEGLGGNHQLTKYYNVSSCPAQLIIDQKMRNFNIDNGIQKKSANELIEYLTKLIQSKG